MVIRTLGFRSLLCRSRYSPSLLISSISRFRFSSLDSFENTSDFQKPSQIQSKKPQSRIKESFVLQELSDLLSINAKPSNLSSETSIEITNPCPFDHQKSITNENFENHAENYMYCLDWLQECDKISNHDQLSAINGVERVEASDLGPIGVSSTNGDDKFSESTAARGPSRVRVGDYLSPTEKLRGVFIQKLKGKANVKSALSATGVDLTIDVVAEVVNEGNLGGEAMVLFFDWAVTQPKISKDLEIYHVVLKALGRRKFFNYVEEILQRMKVEGMSVNSETIFIVMNNFVRARRVAKAFEMFERLEEFGSRRDFDSLNILLQCLCRRSHVGTANSFLNAMRGKLQFNSTTYNVVIGGWAKMGRIDEVERIWKAMVCDRLEPDCVTFSYIIECLGRAGLIENAVEVFNKMEERGCCPSTVVYNSMICNFIAVGDLNECVKYYERMLEKNCQPDVDTYTKLINAFIRVRRVADALEMFGEMLHRGILPSTGMVTSFIEPLCSFGPPHAAMMIYKKAKKVGCVISLKAFKLLLMRLSRFGKCGMVLKVWEDLQDSGHSSDIEIYGYIINGLCNIGQLENAVLVMEEALSKGFCPSKVIYSKLNNKLLNTSKVDIAYKLFLKITNARHRENARRYWRANGWHF